jgi:hypothetical protein
MWPHNEAPKIQDQSSKAAIAALLAIRGRADMALHDTIYTQIAF